jgi:predicted SAM-dependent methyltransferase
MASRAEYLSRLELDTVRGLEFGPVDRPWLPASAPGVRYIDHLSLEELKKKMAAKQTAYDQDKFCDVHFINDGRPLAEILGDWVDLDVVAASHVVEHVPNLLGWFEDLSAVLRPGGEVFLAVPNRRFMFDKLRRVSTIEDVLANYLDKRIQPGAKTILDELFNVVLRTSERRGTWLQELDASQVTHVYSQKDAYKLASETILSGRYYDCHVSIFTPLSFAMLMQDLTRLSLLPFEVVEIEAVTPEFFVILKSCDAGERIEDRLDALNSLAEKLPYNIDDYVTPEFVLTDSRCPLELNGPIKELHDLRVENEHLRGELGRLKASASWRVTKPLRKVRNMLP